MLCSDLDFIIIPSSVTAVIQGHSGVFVHCSHYWWKLYRHALTHWMLTMTLCEFIGMVTSTIAFLKIVKSTLKKLSELSNPKLEFSAICGLKTQA